MSVHPVIEIEQAFSKTIIYNILETEQSYVKAPTHLDPAHVKCDDIVMT